MRVLVVTVVLACAVVASCAPTQPIRRPSAIAEPQAIVVDEVVDRWFENALDHSECRQIQTFVDESEPEPQSVFARLRSLVLLVISNPAQINRYENCTWLEHENDCRGWNVVTTFQFSSARLLYTRNSEDARDLPNEFKMWEGQTLGGEYPNIARDFVRPDRTYAIFASYIDFRGPPGVDAYVVCDLTNPNTLPAILGQPDA